MTAAGSPMVSSAETVALACSNPNRAETNAGPREMRAKLVQPIDRRPIVGAILHPPLKDESDELATRHRDCRTNMCADTGRSQLYPYRITFDLFGCQEIFDLNEARRLHAAHTLNGVREFPAVAGDKFIKHGSQRVAVNRRNVTQSAADRRICTEQEDGAGGRTRKTAGSFERIAPKFRHESRLVDLVRQIVEHGRKPVSESARYWPGSALPPSGLVPRGSKCPR
ncbi:hypothetical protein [Mesorhizobium sp.]|uniref:hypothetical protein n=1 Tax=Mesorhizobium sp. TaxID=1871066 RepID=UPI00257E02C2|nr:hypothetical protein [Mesorhizobium sp.]